MNQYENILLDNQIEPDTIDLHSYSEDIPFKEWVFNEYGLVLRTMPENIELSRCEQEKEESLSTDFKADDENLIVTLPLNFLIIGKKGSAKTTLGFKFLEEIKRLGKRRAYVFKYPKPELLAKLPFKARNLYSLKQLFNLTDSVVLIDEAHKYFDVLNKQVNEDLKKLLASSRQNNNSFIFITHNSYFITRGLFSYIDVRIIKEVNEGHWDMERPHMNKLYSDTNISGAQWFFIDSDFWRGREHFCKPDWFTDEFSNAYKVQNNATKLSFFDRLRSLATTGEVLRK